MRFFPRLASSSRLHPTQDDWRGEMTFLPLEGLKSLNLSLGRPLEPLSSSIRQIGLLRPLWAAMDDDGEPLIIAGSRRLQALREIGRKAAPCRLVAGAPGSPPLSGAVFSARSRTDASASSPRLADSGEMEDPAASLMLMILADNQERGFNQAEQALLWDLIKKKTNQAYWPLLAERLSLKLGSRAQKALEAAVELPESALTELALGRLDADNCLALANFAQPARAKILDLLARALPSRQNRRLWLEWLADLSRLESPDSLLAWLSDGPLAQEAGPEAQKRIRAILRNRRFPVLSKMTARRQKALKELALPTGLKIVSDPELEDVETKLEMTFADADALAALARETARVAASPALRQFFLEDWTDESGSPDDGKSQDSSPRPENG